jgi:hypothetical protein
MQLHIPRDIKAEVIFAFVVISTHEVYVKRDIAMLLLRFSSLRCGNCRCFGSDRAPRVTPQGAFRSRTVLPTVARWFMLGAREIVDNDVQVRAALRCVTPYVLARVLYVMGYKGVL